MAEENSDKGSAADMDYRQQKGCQYSDKDFADRAGESGNHQVPGRMVVSEAVPDFQGLGMVKDLS
jgi:hypothetical protein